MYYCCCHYKSKKPHVALHYSNFYQGGIRYFTSCNNGSKITCCIKKNWCWINYTLKDCISPLLFRFYWHDAEFVLCFLPSLSLFCLHSLPFFRSNAMLVITHLTMHGLCVTLHRVQVNQSMSSIRLPSLIYQSLQFLIQSHSSSFLSLHNPLFRFLFVSITHLHTKHTETHLHIFMNYIKCWGWSVHLKIPPFFVRTMTVNGVQMFSEVVLHDISK